MKAITRSLLGGFGALALLGCGCGAAGPHTPGIQDASSRMKSSTEYGELPNDLKNAPDAKMWCQEFSKQYVRQTFCHSAVEDWARSQEPCQDTDCTAKCDAEKQAFVDACELQLNQTIVDNHPDCKGAIPVGP